MEIHIDNGTTPVIARVTGALNQDTVPSAFAQLQPLFARKAPVSLDLAGVDQMDSAGVALVAHAYSKLGSGPAGCTVVSASDIAADSLKLTGWDFFGSSSDRSPVRNRFFESVGEDMVKVGESAYFFFYVLSESFYEGVVAPFRGVRPRFLIFVEQLSRLGAGSAPIVLLVALLVGLTTAFQSAYELRQFGANIYIADLVAISMMVELGPLMAAILVAGRSGAAITAEIGTMQVNEEIDALRLIGIKPIQYLAVPRIYAVVITQALLGITGAIVGILGGMLIAVTYLDLSVTAFVNEALGSLVLGDLLRNISKSVVFGILIVTTGVYCGFRVSGGAEGVGRATTNSVVISILLIIVADCIFSFI